MAMLMDFRKTDGLQRKEVSQGCRSQARRQDHGRLHCWHVLMSLKRVLQWKGCNGFGLREASLPQAAANEECTSVSKFARSRPTECSAGRRRPDCCHRYRMEDQVSHWNCTINSALVVESRTQDLSALAWQSLEVPPAYSSWIGP